MGRRGRQIHRVKGDRRRARVGVNGLHTAGSTAGAQQRARVRAGVVGVDVVFLAQSLVGRNVFFVQIGIVEDAHAAAAIAAVRRSFRLLRRFGRRFGGSDGAQILRGFRVDLRTVVGRFAAAGRQGDQRQRQTKRDFP